jgi:hypothetical protein
MMVILSPVPGEHGIHKPTGVQYYISGFVNGQLTGRTADGATITADMAEFEPVTVAPAPVLTEPPAPRDAMLTATARRISDLQEQITALQKKLQTVEGERDNAEKMLADLTASTAPAAPPQTQIETRICRNIGENGLSRYLNEGWGILHMQFMPVVNGYEDSSAESLNVVLQREVPVPPPPQPEARAAVPAPAPEPVRTVAGTIVQPEPAAAPEPTGVYASIIRRHDLPISERLALMDAHILQEVSARHAARVEQAQPFTHRPLIATGGIQS